MRASLVAVLSLCSLLGSSCVGAPTEASVRPGINDDFTRPDLDVDAMVKRFETEPGVSREWLLGHVRCGKEQVTAEVEAAGFERVEEVPLGLAENYFLRFHKRAVGQSAGN